MYGGTHMITLGTTACLDPNTAAALRLQFVSPANACIIATASDDWKPINYSSTIRHGSGKMMNMSHRAAAEQLYVQRLLRCGKYQADTSS